LAKVLGVCGECWSLTGQGVGGSRAGGRSACVALLLVIMRDSNAKRGIEEVFLGRVDVGEQGCRAHGVIHGETVCWSWLVP
jgi:hypothetical protein